MTTRSRPSVLFVTNREDLATDYVIRKIQDRDVSYLRINSEDITETSIFAPLTVGATVRVRDTEYDLQNVRAVFFRRAPTVFRPASDPPDTPYLNRERREFLEGLYLGLAAKWINPLFATYAAERKLYQLAVARAAGFAVPKTCACNDPRIIIPFIRNAGPCVIKPISHGMQLTTDGHFSIYTSEITDTNIFNSDALLECPVLIQERVPNHRDVRITVVGQKLFPVAIVKVGSQDVDWRKPEITKSYEVHAVPDALCERILAMHKQLGLLYSAMDFILTPAGDYVFLETNPAGEWLWLEKDLDLNISGALIDELQASG